MSIRHSGYVNNIELDSRYRTNAPILNLDFSGYIRSQQISNSIGSFCQLNTDNNNKVCLP